MKFSRGERKLFCSRECYAAWKTRPVPATCAECGAAFMAVKKDHRWRVKAGQRVYCSTACMKVFCARVSAASLAATNRKSASARMKANNPMWRQEVRAKVSESMRLMGHKPTIRGGNGRGLTEPERLLSECTGLCPVVVPTGGRGHGYPTNYKLDLADPAAKLAIEIDGGSHKSLKVREADARKEAFLRERGWTVLRFSNEEVLADPARCALTVRSTTSKLKASTPM